jgi:hypothetical protein
MCVPPSGLKSEVSLTGAKALSKGERGGLFFRTRRADTTKPWHQRTVRSLDAMATPHFYAHMRCKLITVGVAVGC